ncbi:MAG: hypothetical protein KKF95_03810, partial [Nanoarchaeota archaeon]|nr:hypothetical protein [Nanoarchaeota archaeon]
QYYSQVFLEENLSQNITTGEIVKIYNQSKPSGWFNITLTNLHQGENNITILGERMGLTGPSRTINVFYDNEAPKINISNIPSNLTTNTTTFNFTITDNYNITLPTLLVNITNGTNSTLHVWSGGTSYNTTGWNLGQNITCTGTRYAQACQFTATLNDGTYNMTFQVNDTVNNQNITQKTSIIVASQVTSPTQIIDTGATTDSRSQLNATWTNVTNQTYFSHYELAVGKAIYPNASFNDTKNWFSVGSNTSYQIMNMTLIPGQMYYIHVRTVNIFGATSQVKNTDGIAIEDNSPPEYIPGSSVWVGTDSNNLWTNENSTLRGLWNFTDNETGINKFMFAIGTAKYPQSGWDSVLAQKETTNFGFNESGLTLQQNKSYYFSVKAKNGYQYGFGWSDWYSSEYIKQDLTTPTGGSISYQPGNYTAGSITLTYLTGDDYLSGYNYGQLLMKKTNYSSINGGCNAYSDYETLNVSMVKVDTPTSYFYTSLQDGKCYKFGLKVYDKAGNSVIYTLGNEDYNVTADSTAPSTVMITDDGVITGSRNLLFSWTEAIDPHTGIRNYQYALGTTPGADNIVNFTSNNLTRTLTLNNLPLQDEQIYYLTVKAYNRVGLVSTSYSDGVLYLDMDTPTALTVVKVANDTNASNGYHDFDNDTNTTILLTGENSLTCAWSYYDIDYTQPSQLTNYSWACTNTANNPVNRTGNYTCEIETPNEAVYTVHVNCKDDAGNKQLASENTDITFIKENEPPQINITYPENNIIVNGVISANVSIWDVSNYTARYELREYVNNTLIINQTISNLSNITMNTTGLGGEYIFRVFATDDYNHTSNESVNFVVNNNAPTVRIILSNTYQNSDFNFSIASTLYYNISYNITNITGTLIQNNSWNNTQLIAANTTIISVSASTLPEGVYTIRVVARDNSSNITANKSFIIDKTAPEYRGTLQVEPTEIIYENDTIKLYLNWKETTSLDSIWVVHNANGSSVNYTATNTTPGSQIYENFTRYKVEIPSFMTRTNQTINYTWYARDKAGNQNNTSTNNLYITNRVPNITTTNLSNALLGVSYQENVLFNDSDDSHNNSDFSCAVEGLPITTMIIGTTTCRLTWDSPTPVANNTINVTVTDGINTTKKAFNLTVLQTRVHNITVNTSHTVTSEYWLNNTLMRIITTSGNTNTTLLESANYTLKLKIDNLQMTTSNFNITSNLDVFFQLLNKNTIDNNETGMGLNRTRIPVEAYVFRLNVTPERNGTYEMAFNYTKYPSVTTSKLRIIKLGYDETTGIINYTNATSLTTTLDTSRQLVYATVSNFSAFILVEDTTAPSTPPSGGGRGGGSSRRSGGSFFIPPPTCNDNISNQGEIGVDCGGPCPPCQTCHDTIQNQGEEGVDCGGPCIRCIAPTCNDRIKNGDEEEVDCGGSCRLCTPTPTCTDGILNGGEQGIDCGGSCIPCPGCTNGIRDAGEEGVDCGGVCEQECGPEVIEKPVEVKKTPAYVWFIVLGIIIMGGLVAMWIYKKEERKVKKTAAQVAAEQEEIIDLQDEERSVMARYINKYLAQGFKENDVKNQLLVDGFRQTHIDLVTAAVIRDLKVQEIQDYITDYTKKGYTADELKEWILNQGIEESLLKEAESKLQRAKGDANPSQSELSDIDVDNLLEKKEKRL